MIQHSSACSALCAQHVLHSVHSTGIRLGHPNDLKDCYGVEFISDKCSVCAYWSTSGWILSLEGQDSTHFEMTVFRTRWLSMAHVWVWRTFKLVILFSTSDVRWACWLVLIILKYPRYLGSGVSIEELPLPDWHAGLFVSIIMINDGCRRIQTTYEFFNHSTRGPCCIRKQRTNNEKQASKHHSSIASISFPASNFPCGFPQWWTLSWSKSFPLKVVSVLSEN